MSGASAPGSPAHCGCGFPFQDRHHRPGPRAEGAPKWGALGRSQREAAQGLVGGRSGAVLRPAPFCPDPHGLLLSRQGPLGGPAPQSGMCPPVARSTFEGHARASIDPADRTVLPKVLSGEPGRGDPHRECTEFQDLSSPIFCPSASLPQKPFLAGQEPMVRAGGIARFEGACLKGNGELNPGNLGMGSPFKNCIFVVVRIKKFNSMSDHITTKWLGGMAFESNNPSGLDLKIDAAPDSGGAGDGLRPKALMLSALAGCSGLDVASLIKKMKLEVDDFRIETKAELTEEHPRYY